MARARPSHAYAETVLDEAAEVNSRVPQEPIGNAAAVAPRTEAKSNAELIADAAAKLKIT